jgi:hypothetical protein
LLLLQERKTRLQITAAVYLDGDRQSLRITGAHPFASSASS